MHREKLTAAVKAAARERGLCFHTGYEYQINEMLKETPAIWLAPLEAVKSEGLKEGLKTYSMKMILIEIPDRDQATDPERLWRLMEDNASAVCNIIAGSECVKSVSDVELSAAKDSITNRGEISMSITMVASVPFSVI